MEEEEGGHLAVHLHDNSPVTNVPSVAVEAEEGGRLTIHLHDGHLTVHLLSLLHQEHVQLGTVPNQVQDQKL